jgi:two-component system, OmpR family, phosphate regulon response regulator PhoB
MTAAPAVHASSKFSFERAETLVFDAVPTNRGTARNALGMLGFQHLTATSAFDDVATTLSDHMFDLFIADVTHEAGRTCNLVRRIREGSVGRNPFLHIVLMTWKLEGDLVEQALNCGADDLITRPFSVDFLGARLRTHAEARKAFAITSDYIGPDRRKGRGHVAAVQLIDVPNLLLAKAQDPRWSDHSAKLAHEAIKAARGKVNGERACRSAFQLAVLVQSLRDAFKSMGPLEGDLARLEEMAKDLAMRVEGRDGEMEILQLISALRGDVAGAQSGENVASHIDSMDETSASLLEKITPGRGRDLVREAASAFAAAKARGRKS